VVAAPPLFISYLTPVNRARKADPCLTWCEARHPQPRYPPRLGSQLPLVLGAHHCPSRAIKDLKRSRPQTAHLITRRVWPSLSAKTSSEY